MSWKLLGKNDEVTTCECCGKAGLKLTVIMTDGEREVRYGTACAARVLSPRYRLTGRRVEILAWEASEQIRRAEMDRAYYAGSKGGA